MEGSVGQREDRKKTGEKLMKELKKVQKREM